ncbi:XRE family transcriptional regulator [Brevibacillus laterosporus]|nr:helix-turn-helix transcriptional regulator [Brevibacillus laterosporus]TPG70369.1 XRE family transcriptional regulator [Brevibacillus laterosporus]
MGACEIGNLFEQHRISKNVSIHELSEDTGISKSVLYRILSGETKRPSLNSCKKIMNVLDVPLVSLINAYIMVTQRPTSLQVLLTDAMTINDKELVIKIAKKLLESPRMDSFLSMDYLLQFLSQVENKNIKLALYDVIIDYSRQRGIPYYLSKALYNRYLVERDDFSRFEETYHRAKEVLHYINFLHPTERISLYYRLGVHAYVLNYYEESIEFCKKGINEDRVDSKQKASAVISLTASYLNLDNLEEAEIHLKDYENSPYVDYRQDHLRAVLHTRKKEYPQAVDLLKSCLDNVEIYNRISIVNDLLDVYLKMNHIDLIKELIDSEEDFLPTESGHPNKIKNTAQYYKQKGLCQLSIGCEEEGVNSLLQSIFYNQKLGSYRESMKCIALLLDYHKQNKKILSFENMEKISVFCHNDNKKEQGR